MKESSARADSNFSIKCGQCGAFWYLSQYSKLSDCHTYLCYLGSLLLNTDASIEIPTLLKTCMLWLSYLYNYGDFTPFNTFMFMYINIYGEIDSSIKKIVIQFPWLHQAVCERLFHKHTSYKSKGCDMFLYYQATWWGKKWNGVCDLYYSRWQVNMWVMACGYQMRFVVSLELYKLSKESGKLPCHRAIHWISWGS